MITVLYTCHGCGREKQKAFVRERHPNEDILDYMKEVAEVVSDAHSMASPGCKHRTCDLMIPLTENAPIGNTKPV